MNKKISKIKKLMKLRKLRKLRKSKKKIKRQKIKKSIKRGGSFRICVKKSKTKPNSTNKFDLIKELGKKFTYLITNNSSIYIKDWGDKLRQLFFSSTNTQQDSSELLLKINKYFQPTTSIEGRIFDNTSDPSEWITEEETGFTIKESFKNVLLRNKDKLVPLNYIFGFFKLETIKCIDTKSSTNLRNKIFTLKYTLDNILMLNLDDEQESYMDINYILSLQDNDDDNNYKPFGTEIYESGTLINYNVDLGENSGKVELKKINVTFSNNGNNKYSITIDNISTELKGRTLSEYNYLKLEFVSVSVSDTTKILDKELDETYYHITSINDNSVTIETKEDLALSSNNKTINIVFYKNFEVSDHKCKKFESKISYLSIGKYICIGLSVFKAADRTRRYFKINDLSGSINLNDETFNPIAITAHIGSSNINSGHYVTFRKKPNDDESWWEINDSNLKDIPDINDRFNNSTNIIPVLFLYEKQNDDGNLIDDIHTEYKRLFIPSNDLQILNVNDEPTTINNPNNQCFLNSTIQLLLACKQYVYYLQNYDTFSYFNKIFETNN